jgi:secreted trypsin-like serine protease
MAYIKFLIFYLFVCNVDLISAIIYSCNSTADCGCSKTNANVYKIVGGENAFPFSWGWAASLQLPFFGHFCTGSIVSPLHIITAAHCIMEKEYMEIVNVVVGIDTLGDLDSTLAQVRSVDEVFVHPEYDNSTKFHDIAVIQLNESLVFSNETSIARICLPRIEPSDRETEYPANSASLVAIGWGLLSADAESIPDDLHLQQVTVKAVSVDDETCTEFIANSSFQFCAGENGGGKGKKVHFHHLIELYLIHNLDTCQGDSGGPLMRFESAQKQWVLAGVTSFGLGCGDPRYSGVYTRASAYRKWLQLVISDGFIESLGHLESVASENYCNIYIVLLSLVQLCFISLGNK